MPRFGLHFRNVVLCIGAIVLTCTVGCQRAAPQPVERAADAPAADAAAFAGSSNCRECHEDFYRKWAPSMHGLAMQPYTPAFATAKLTPSAEPVNVAKQEFRAEVTPHGGFVVEVGGDGRRYKIEHVLGGKNVYYFLTLLSRGRLQVLPLGYDVHTKSWFDVPGSGVRHFHAAGSDTALDWHHSAFTFNTSCFSCHVSQLSRNYDPATDTYHTTWNEPGINCETCHGPGGEHVRACKALKPGEKLKELKLISIGQLSVDRQNMSCAPCHAKMGPITETFMPGDDYFDHFDLIGFENADFYPDGRDLGENYTYTSWRMSPCAKSGELSCLHCHTSSGRNRFEQDPNQACAPCHNDKVKNPTVHTIHKSDSAGNRCVACHMPTTRFAAMMRTDHSMRPPTPATTLAYKSPNACNLCHKDEDAKWSDRYVREWRKRDYQAPVLHWAGLLDAARKRDFQRLPEMLRQINRPERDEMVAAAFARALHSCDDPRKTPVLLRAIAADASPLVRAAAIDGLGQVSPDTVASLSVACGDNLRLVRVRAAAMLAGVPPASLPDDRHEAVRKATQECITSFRARPDHWASHYNLGNFYQAQGRLPLAVSAFEKAIKLEPEALMPYVNVSIAYAQLQRLDDAERVLRKALAIDKNFEAAMLNLAMLMAERGKPAEAELLFRDALKANPRLAQAAYNLSLLLAGKDQDESLEFARAAYRLEPTTKYGTSLAMLLIQAKKYEEARKTLTAVLDKDPAFLDGYRLMASVLLRERKKDEAVEYLKKAVESKQLPPEVRRELSKDLRALGGER